MENLINKVIFIEEDIHLPINHILRYLGNKALNIVDFV